MQGVFKKFAISVFVAFVVPACSFALDNEYKNSLIKVEFSKKDASSYNIDLTTQKKYVEPVKIIKKNDLNYYILLPETKNSALNLNSSSSDIKSISTSSYNYTNQDKNGYTKININTSRPVNFVVNVKSLSQGVTPLPAPKQSQKAVNVEQKATKTTNSIAQANTTFKKEVENQKKNLENNKVSSKEKASTIKKNFEEKNQAKKDSLKKDPLKKENIKKENIKKTTNSSLKIKKEENVGNARKGLEEKVEEKVVEENSLAEQETLSLQEENQEDIEKAQNEAQDEVQDENIEENIEENGELASFDFLSTISNKTISILKKAKNIAQKGEVKGISFLKIFKIAIFGLIIFVSLFLFLLLVVIIIENNKKRNRRIKESLGLSGFKKNGEFEEKEKKQKSGQYFVFDKNVAQNFYNPNETRSLKKHYELSSYEPDLQINYNNDCKKYATNSNKKAKNKENEYDIIQKILKEDSLIEFEPDELKKIEQPEPRKSLLEEPRVEKKVKIKEEIKKEEKKEPSSPIVLSSVEIAPERGFMCVSYNDNINLLGYIFDDVFALYNFKKPKLENYDIKFRLSEKDDKGANFIVKVGEEKMLIRVTKSFMTLEVLM